MTIVTHVAAVLAAVIIGGLCLAMYLDMPLRARRVLSERSRDSLRPGHRARGPQHP